MSAAAGAALYRVVADGIEIAVRLTPNARNDAVDGRQTLADGSTVLAVRVRAIAAKGAANTALEKTLAAALGVAPSRVAVAKGTTARRKLVHIAGDPAQLAAALGDAVSAAERGKERP